MTKKVLIVISDVAGGHRSGAQALQESLNNNHPELEVKIVDILDSPRLGPFSTHELNRSHRYWTKNKLIALWMDFFFRVVNISPFFQIFRTVIVLGTYKHCERVFLAEKADIIVSVHPFTSVVVNEFKRKFMRGDYKKYSALEGESAAWNPKTVSMITDLVTLFRGWADTNADLVTCGSEEAKLTCVKFGVSPARIEAPLFPIKPSHTKFRPREVVLGELGLSIDKKTILLTAGGTGALSVKKAIKLIAKKTSHQLIIVAGKLDRLKEKLQKQYAGLDRIKVLGFVNNMPDFMNAADLIISKPGPATVLEIELFNKPAILTRYVGYQETGNVDYAAGNPNFRYIASDWTKLLPEVETLLKVGGIKIKESEHRRKFNECDQIATHIVYLL